MVLFWSYLRSAARITRARSSYIYRTRARVIIRDEGGLQNHPIGNGEEWETMNGENVSLKKRHIRRSRDSKIKVEGVSCTIYIAPHCVKKEWIFLCSSCVPSCTKSHIERPFVSVWNVYCCLYLGYVYAARSDEKSVRFPQTSHTSYDQCFCAPFRLASLWSPRYAQQMLRLETNKFVHRLISTASDNKLFTKRKRNASRAPFLEARYKRIGR